MGACELCGIEGVGTKPANVSQNTLECCNRCIDSMGLKIDKPPPTISSTLIPESQVLGKGISGMDIMTRDKLELSNDFYNKIRLARKENGLTQEDLAEKLNMKVGVIQKIENGVRQTDSILMKISKFLGVEIYVEPQSSNFSVVASEGNRQMTISDARENIVEKERKKKNKKKGRKLGVSRTGARTRRQ